MKKLRVSLLTGLAVAGLSFPMIPSGSAQEAGEGSPFATPTIDLGVVVRDVEASVRFYTEAIGFRELPGFHVPVSVAEGAGLTEGKSLDIRVLVLGEGPGATKLKLMSVPGVESRRNRNRHIHTTLGYSYITIMVKDTTAAVERLKAAGVKPIAQGPVELPESLAKGVFLTVVRDPDGNFVELVGPRASAP